MELRCISQHFSKKRKFNFEKKRSIVQLFINARRYDDALHAQKMKRKRNEKREFVDDYENYHRCCLSFCMLMTQYYMDEQIFV